MQEILKNFFHFVIIEYFEKKNIFNPFLNKLIFNLCFNNELWSEALGSDWKNDISAAEMSFLHSEFGLVPCVGTIRNMYVHFSHSCQMKSLVEIELVKIMSIGAVALLCYCDSLLQGEELWR